MTNSSRMAIALGMGLVAVLLFAAHLYIWPSSRVGDVAFFIGYVVIVLAEAVIIPFGSTSTHDNKGKSHNE